MARPNMRSMPTKVALLVKGKLSISFHGGSSYQCKWHLDNDPDRLNRQEKAVLLLT